MEGVCLGGFREDGGAELELAVVAGDEVEQVQADVLVAGLAGCEGFEFRGAHQVVPELVRQLDAERDVAEHLAVFRVDLAEAFLGVAVFPELAAIVEKHAGDHQVAVEFRVETGDRVCGAHHLRDVLHQPAAAGMMVFPGGGGAAEPVSHRGEEMGAEFVQARIGQAFAEGGDFGEILFLLPPDNRITGEEISDGGIIEPCPADGAAVDAVLVLGPLAIDPDDGVEREIAGQGMERRFGPDFQAEGASGIRENKVEIGLPALGRFHGAGLQLRRHRGDQGHLARLLFQARYGNHAHSQKLRRRPGDVTNRLASSSSPATPGSARHRWRRILRRSPWHGRNEHPPRRRRG